MTLRIITVKVPSSYLVLIDRLVRKGLYGSRSEFIRQAIREKLEQYLREHPELLQDVSTRQLGIEPPRSSREVKVIYLGQHIR